MIPIGRSAGNRCAQLLALLTIAFLAIGCSGVYSSSNGNGTASAAPESPPADNYHGVSYNEDDRKSFELLPTKLVPSDLSSSAPRRDSAPALGQCVSLSDATGKFTQKDCKDGTYRVVQVVTMPDECVSDVDQKAYWGNRSTQEFYTLCLDIAWNPDKCFEVLKNVFSDPMSCSFSRADRTRVTAVRVVDNSSDRAVCGRDDASVKDVRRFVVCFRNI